jgi:hypothetical protein
VVQARIFSGFGDSRLNGIGRTVRKITHISCDVNGGASRQVSLLVPGKGDILKNLAIKALGSDGEKIQNHDYERKSFQIQIPVF